MRIVTVLLFLTYSIVAQGQSILGTWKTIDDETGKPKSHVKIYKAQDGLIYGKIVELLREPGEEQNPVCDECAKSDKRYNQPVRGMAIVTKMELAADKKSAKGGKILDPKNGRVYGCIMTLQDDNNTLNVRGFLGFSALGRTQTWERID